MGAGGGKGVGFLKVTGRREQGDTAQVGKTYPKTPVSERSERIGVFPGPSGHGPQRGHAPRSALCGGIVLACGANRPTPISPAARLGMSYLRPTPLPPSRKAS